MQRIAVVGSSGSGKTTTARAISSGLGIPHLELDSVFHQPGWTPPPTDEFQDAVRTFTDQEAWVVDGNYTGQGIVAIQAPRAPSAALRPDGRCSRLPHSVGEANKVLLSYSSVVTQSPSAFP